MPTSVVLSPHFESFVKQQVSAGRSSNVIDMARAGLRLLKDREDPKALKLHELRAAIEAGARSGLGLSAEQVLDRLG